MVASFFFMGGLMLFEAGVGWSTHFSGPDLKEPTVIVSNYAANNLKLNYPDNGQAHEST